MSTSTRGFLTLACGSRWYVRMAKGLVRSMRLRGVDDPVAIVTDRPDGEIEKLFDIILPAKAEFGTGVEQKIHLDCYSPFDETLFIDADCLVYKDPKPLWEMYDHASGFGVRGWRYFGAHDSHYSIADMAECLRRCGVSRMASFNGGIYFIRKGAGSARLFDKARAIYRHRSELGLRPFKAASVNDEPVIALAMEQCGIEIIPWGNGEAMCTALGEIRGHHRINVLTGNSAFSKNGNQVDPVVIHFNVECQDYYTYRRELRRLLFGRFPGSDALTGSMVVPEYLWLNRRMLARSFKQILRRTFRTPVSVKNSCGANPQ